jgi:AcrR family transcriptional regulator
MEGKDLEHISGIEARERIINASRQLFSQKGYDATRVNDIAKAANVNKALIYYYFKSKEDILDFMVNSLLDNAVSLTLDFIQKNIVHLIENGYLDIRPDRLHFANGEAVNQFMHNALKFNEQLLDYVIENREIIRILMLESLKSGKHRKSLFRLMDYLSGSEKNPIYKTISDVDRDFVFSDEMVLFEFFFSILPIVNFAAYYDEYKAAGSLSDQELRDSFLRVTQVICTSMISGSDILLRNNSIKL